MEAKDSPMKKRNEASNEKDHPETAGVDAAVDKDK